VKKPKYNQNSAIRGALRRAFARSPIVQEIMSQSRREVPRYKKDGTRHKKNAVQRQCQVCNAWVGSSKISVDHISPVISVDDGFQDWNEFVSRLWCDKENLQRICDECHNKKTYQERIARLLKKYTEELNELEKMIKDHQIETKIAKKQLNKYITKNKTKGLEPVVERARELKQKI
jgi:5-methylcytosine-specific restriction endonuclease McrA